MSSAVVVVVLLLCCCFCCSESKDECDQYAAVGDAVTIKLQHKWTNKDSVKWLKGNEVLVYCRGNIFVTKKKGLGPDGSLKLDNVTKADAGSYKPDVHDSNGKTVGELPSTRLCVLERVRKPKVKFTCRESKKDTKVEFTCIPAQKSLTVDYQWLQNGKDLGNTSSLKLDVTKLENEAVTCKVSDRASSSISDPVTHNCYKSGGILPETLLGIDIWIIVGGGAGIVLLLIILVIICCLRARRTKRMRLRDEEELRLEFTRPEKPPQYAHPADRQQQQQHRHHHHHHHHQHQQQQPAGHTGPRQHRSRQHRNQPLPKTPDQANGAPQPSPRRSAQPPKAANDEHPPPLPQPRKKAPRKA